jgi:hypothetical protein
MQTLLPVAKSKPQLAGHNHAASLNQSKGTRKIVQTLMYLQQSENFLHVKQIFSVNMVNCYNLGEA